MIKITKSTEIQMGKDARVFNYCPFCGTELEYAWQHIREDDANPVRICNDCDTAWIWHIYD